MSITKFQFTHPRGVRHLCIIYIPYNKSFNSRTHVGVRRSYPINLLILIMFQFTHPRGGGATVARLFYAIELEFQFTHPHVGVRLEECSIQNLYLYVSIHAPPRGGATAKIDKIYLIFYLSLLHFSCILSYDPISLHYFLSHPTWFPGVNLPIRIGPALYL